MEMPHTSSWARMQVALQGFGFRSVWLGPWEAAYLNSFPKECHQEGMFSQPNNTAAQPLSSTHSVKKGHKLSSSTLSYSYDKPLSSCSWLIPQSLWANARPGLIDTQQGPEMT